MCRKPSGGKAERKSAVENVQNSKKITEALRTQQQRVIPPNDGLYAPSSVDGLPSGKGCNGSFRGTNLAFARAHAQHTGRLGVDVAEHG